MSEMVANKGVIKELHKEEPTLKAKLERLAEDLGLPNEDVFRVHGENDYDIVNYKDYTIINGRLFDITGARGTYDADEYRESIRRLNGTDLEVDLYYYSGGTCMEEIVGEYLSKEPKHKMNEMDLVLSELMAYCKLHNSGEKADWNALESVYGDPDIEKVLAKLPDSATWEKDSSSDNQSIYAVAWVQHGRPQVQLFRVEHN